MSESAANYLSADVTNFDENEKLVKSKVCKKQKIIKESEDKKLKEANNQVQQQLDSIDYSLRSK